MPDHFRAAGPKSGEYNDLETLINKYYEMIQKKRREHVVRFFTNIRKYVLTHGCSDEDIAPEVSQSSRANQEEETRMWRFVGAGHELPTIRKVEDTLRGRLWRVLIGVGKLSSSQYQKMVSQGTAPEKDYTKIRGDTKRTFLTSTVYKSRVSEERLVRVLNSYVHKTGKAYVQGLDCVGAHCLHVMPEVHAYHTLLVLVQYHMPLYYIR